MKRCPQPQPGRSPICAVHQLENRAHSPLNPIALIIFLASSLILAPSLPASEPELQAAQIDFFEKNIRPVLVESCYECHSAQANKQKGGLRLDSRDSLLAGGDSGPALKPGHPDQSLLIQAIRYGDESLQMPPKNKKLPDNVIENFVAWVQMGAPDPRQPSSTQAVPPPSKTDHWAFQPVRQPPVPQVRNESWVLNPIDAFVLAKLENHQLHPSPTADPRTFIRRAHYDLLGLPPTPADVEAFIESWEVNPHDAVNSLVDRLLASPHYGERWGRYWLDVARYADTKGYLAGGAQRRFPFSYTYRDYVIRSLNEDLPFDQFIVEQLAADKLDLGDDQRPLAALGFLTLGRRFLNNQHDIIDDRIDVVTRGLMGLTVACSRCHDHKFDPIPIEDYYSLYGVFSNSEEPSQYPLLGTEPPQDQYHDYLAEKERRQSKLEEFRRQKTDEAMAKLREEAATYLWTALEALPLGDRGEVDSLARKRKLETFIVQRWMNVLPEWKAQTNAILAPWFAYAENAQSEAPQPVDDISARFTRSSPNSPALPEPVANLFAESAPANLEALAQAYAPLFRQADKLWQEELEAAQKENRPPQPLSQPTYEFLRQTLYADGAPANPPAEEQDRLLDGARPRLRELQAEIDEVDATHEGAPPRAMALVDKDPIRNPQVFVRGNSGNRGKEVPIQFLELVAGPDREPFTDGSGRLEMARAIASRDNPLTARVLVNRVWMHHIGKPLVLTPSDFGVRAEPPSHPELLDWLADWFMDQGWSLKKLHRLVMTSNTYRQSSAFRPDASQADPENTLVWRMNRRRLDLESMRDTLLAVAGNLNLTQGGRSVDIVDPPFSPRRTVYGFIERQNLPGLFRTFDFASPDTTSAGRFTTTVPQQALFLLNSPFILQQAHHLLDRISSRADDEQETKLTELFRLAYQRAPSPQELDLMQSFLDRQPAKAPLPNAARAWTYGYGPWNQENNLLEAFHPLPYFGQDTWKGGPDLPAPNLGWVSLTSLGGHPGDPQHAAVRRWTAPADGKLRVEGELNHPSEHGNGVRASILSNRLGLLGQWTAHQKKSATHLESISVQKGDTLDFIVDCLGETSHDSFHWSPSLQYLELNDATDRILETTWNARQDFQGPASSQDQPLEPWEELAQAILISNELFFVD